MLGDYVDLILEVVPPRTGRPPKGAILRYIRAVIDRGTDRVPLKMLGTRNARVLRRWGIVYSTRGGGNGDVRATEIVRPIIEQILSQDVTLGVMK